MKKYKNGALVDMTQGEVSERQQQEALYESESIIRASSEVRNQRDRLLLETDWMALSDNTMAQDWATYRQALRDITDQTGFPNNVTWPTEPS
tara:strand:- start:25 stop:300 length:276 start_codon:yes stop_codon:yes gene_type:complete